MTFTINMELGAAAESVGLLRAVVADAANSLGLDKPLTDDLKTVVSEAATNAVLHPYGPAGGTLRFSMELQGQSLELLIGDCGGGIHSEPTTQRQRLGLGLVVISALADRTELASTPAGGTEVRMTFRLKQPVDRWRGGGVAGQLAGGAASPPRHRQLRAPARAGAASQRARRNQTPQRHGLDSRTVDQARGYINRLRQIGRG